jgi:hypothetical protein
MNASPFMPAMVTPILQSSQPCIPPIIVGGMKGHGDSFMIGGMQGCDDCFYMMFHKSQPIGNVVQAADA